jgi:hypothetical protein
LQPVNFQHALLIPEAQGATGGYLWLKPDLAWSLTNVDYPPNGFSLTTINGLSNFALALYDAWQNPEDGGENGPANNTGGTIRLPYTGPGNVLNLADAGVSGSWHLASPNIGNWPLLMSALQFACEIAQQTCMYNASQTTQDFTGLSQDNLLEVSAGVARSALIEVYIAPEMSSVLFGSTGVPMLGWYAWEYDGYYGSLQYLNSFEQWTIPEQPTATGLYLILQPGVEANVTIGVNEFVSMSTVTTFGEINFAAGVAAGLYHT